MQNEQIEFDFIEFLNNTIPPILPGITTTTTTERVPPPPMMTLEAGGRIGVVIQGWSTSDIVFTGAPGTTAVVALAGQSYTIGNVGGSFVWDMNGTPHTFSSPGESFPAPRHDIIYRGAGSIFFTVSSGVEVAVIGVLGEGLPWAVPPQDGSYKWRMHPEVVISWATGIPLIAALDSFSKGMCSGSCNQGMSLKIGVGGRWNFVTACAWNSGNPRYIRSQWTKAGPGGSSPPDGSYYNDGDFNISADGVPSSKSASTRDWGDSISGVIVESLGDF